MSKKPTNPDQLPWFKCYQDLWLDGTRDLTPEQRGIYFDCLCLIYKYDQPLRDDVDWVSHKLHVKPRVWKRVRDDLIACGKLVQTPDGLTNGRAESEIVERGLAKEMRTKSKKNRPIFSGNDAKKSNENNKTKAQEVRSKNETVEIEGEYQSTSTPTTTVQSSQSEEAKIFEASLDVIDLQTYRIDLSTRAKLLIADMGVAVEDVMRRARDAARQQRKPITHQDLYCVAIAAREVDPTLSKPAASRYAKRLLNGEDAQAPPADARRHALTPEQLRRTTAPASLRSNLAKTGLLSRK